MSLVTVIVAHHDCPQYLGAAVQSILEQELGDLRLVVVDDASPGNDWIDALRPLADPRLTAFRASRNVGHYRIKNRVLEGVTTPYVALQDADDASDPRRLARQVPLLERGAGVVGCGFEEVDAEGAPLGARRMPRNANLALRLGKRFVLHHGTTVARREVLQRLGGFDGTARVAADSDFALRASRVCRIRNVPDVLYRYRRWPGSLTARTETGYGSPEREAYAAAMRGRERARRQARGADLERLLCAPANDLDFDVEPVAL